ncbi:MAG: type III-B CRISPR module RAMP protein Cmr1 [Thermomicrobiales bacterium]|nr:MAG: type III-B CRISPR module RAMP protein Cmr1 [Thermomicrobiales bacterium]
MKRRIPPVTPVRLSPSREPLLELDVKVVTPMFGGSDTPGEVDPELPVRGGTVRGHLRFWWRACFGHRYASAEQLFQDESAIWGATSGNEGLPAKIDVEVEVRHSGTAYPPENEPLSPQQWTRDDGYPAYALFPFQRQSSTNQPPKRARRDVAFTLRLWPAAHVTGDAERDHLKREASAAVWAWIAFGGIGARTRRGCGTLWTNHPDFCPSAGTPASQWLQQRARQHLTGDAVATPLPIPLLKGATVLIRQQPAETNKAWREAVNWLRGYRQRRTGGATGRSLWPEPAAIRVLTGRGARGAPPPETPRYFPRGELGLPIIFHFKDQREGDPPDQTLQAGAEGATRMASPFITKAIAINERQGLPMVVGLQEPLLHQLGVQVELNGQPVVVHDRQLAQQVEPLRQYGVDNAVDGFVEFVKRQGQIAEVTLR